MFYLLENTINIDKLSAKGSISVKLAPRIYKENMTVCIKIEPRLKQIPQKRRYTNGQYIHKEISTHHLYDLGNASSNQNKI